MKQFYQLSLLFLMACYALCAHADNFESATDAVANMKVGWNLGNTLESNSGDTLSMWIEANKSRTCETYETAWGQAVTTRALIKMMKDAGFNTIRVPVTWYPHMEATFNSVKGYNNSQGQWCYTPWLPSQDSIGTQIDADWMQRVKEVVDYVIDEGMYCILNVHHDTGSSSTAWLVADMDVYEKEKNRFEAVWTQIANTFKDYDEHLLFEGYNEMLDSKDSWCFASFNADNHYDEEISTSAYKAINSFAQCFVNAVRATGGNNAERNLIVNTYGGCDGSGTWNTHLQDPLKNLTLPNDPATGHLAIEVHSYPDVTSLETVKATVDADITNWKNYLQSKGAPVIVGEWGTSTTNAYENYRSNLLEYATYFVQQAKAAGIATIHWMGLSDGTSRSVPEWSQADLKDAIIKGYYGEEGPSSVEGITEPDAPQSVYTLSGVKLNTNEPLSPGIYIKGGKKFVVIHQ
jgi:endoglucanase